jgi:periplasmic protein TonB
VLSITTLRPDPRDADDGVLGWALTSSMFAHLTFVAALLAGGIEIGSATSVDGMRPRSPEPVPSPPMVFLAPPAVVADGSGRGGGGGGNRTPGPIRRAQSVGRDPYTLRVAKPAGTSGRLVDAPAVPAPALDATPMASGVFEQIGLPLGGSARGISLGPGTGGGVGDGVGTGIGSERGPGYGAGTGAGSGGGVYRPGGNVTAPALLVEIHPSYTADALLRRVQGSVELELVVMADGTPSNIRVVRPLDPGLDQEAINAVQRWTFAPGRRGGTAVNVLVRAVLDFIIH